MFFCFFFPLTFLHMCKVKLFFGIIIEDKICLIIKPPKTNYKWMQLFDASGLCPFVTQENDIGKSFFTKKRRKEIILNNMQMCINFDIIFITLGQMRFLFFNFIELQHA